ncbi:MAG TPA: MerR family DNA-binding transcriptional regulator, partial [Planctomycetota bacterium]|nr:MerR family DNA-binding transcriptional regulator [Planctomycetota bacterium]
SIGRIAKTFGVTTQTIRNWIKQGFLEEAQRTPGGHRRFKVEDIQSIMIHRNASKKLNMDRIYSSNVSNEQTKDQDVQHAVEKALEKALTEINIENAVKKAVEKAVEHATDKALPIEKFTRKTRKNIEKKPLKKKEEEFSKVKTIQIIEDFLC